MWSIKVLFFKYCNETVGVNNVFQLTVIVHFGNWIIPPLASRSLFKLASASTWHDSSSLWQLPWFLEILLWTVRLLSHVWLFATLWTVAYQASLSMRFSGKSTGVGCHFLLQGIFPTQGSNPGLLHCRQMLYLLSHQGSHQGNFARYCQILHHRGSIVLPSH